MFRINAGRNPNPNPHPDPNAPQDQAAAGQQDAAMHDGQEQPPLATDNPGNAPGPLGGPVDGPDPNAPQHAVFGQHDFAAPGGGVNFQAPQNPVFMQQHFAGPVGGPNFNAPQHAVFGQHDFAGAGGGMNFPALQHTLFRERPLGGIVGAMNFQAPQNPVFMQQHFAGPAGGQGFNAPQHAVFGQPPLGGIGGDRNFNPPQDPALMQQDSIEPRGGTYYKPSYSLTPLDSTEARGRMYYNPPVDYELMQKRLSEEIASKSNFGTPAQREFKQILQGPESAPFVELYLKPSQRFVNDPAAGLTALMLAAQDGDYEAVGALLSRSIMMPRTTTVLPRTSDELYNNSDYFYNICQDERERRGQDRVPFEKGEDFVQIPNPRGGLFLVDKFQTLLSEALTARALDGRSPLMFAAEGGNILVAEKLLRKGADIHAYADDGRTALTIAVKSGHANIVSLLIESGALISPVKVIEDVFEVAGFSLAAHDGNIGVVRALLNEIPVLTACRNEWFARQLSADSYSSPAVKDMLSEARDNEEKLIAAAKGEDPRNLEKIIEDKSPVWLNAALRTICGHGLADAVEPLIRRGADVNAKTSGGQTAMRVAVDYGHGEVVKKLLENGAVVSRSSAEGTAALGKVARRGDIETMRHLLAHLAVGPEFSRPWRVDRSPHDAAQAALDIAAEHGQVEVVRMLFDETAGNTYSLAQIAQAGRRAQAAGQADVARLLASLAPIAEMLEVASGFDTYGLAQMDQLIARTADMNATLGKDRLDPFLAMVGIGFDRAVGYVRSPREKPEFYQFVGSKLLRAGVDATVRNEKGESVLKLVAMARAFGLANEIVKSGQAEEAAADEVRSTLLNGQPIGRFGESPDVEFTRNSSLLDWLVFSEPVSEQGKHYAKLLRHGVWPRDPGDVDQRRDAMRSAAENGCPGVILALGDGADPAFIQELLLRAAKAGSWNVVKTLVNAGWEDVLDNEVMGAALKSAVDHRNHAAVDDIFRWNELLVEKGRRAVGRTLTGSDLEAVFQSLATEGTVAGFGILQTDFKMVERLIKSAPGALLPEGAGPNGLAPLFTKRLLQHHQAWATFDHVWCAQGVSEEDKGLLQPYARWPLDEQDGAQISFAMEAAARSGCPHLFRQLHRLPALEQWRQSPENAIAFNAMMQRATLAAAAGPNHNMFALV